MIVDNPDFFRQKYAYIFYLGQRDIDLNVMGLDCVHRSCQAKAGLWRHAILTSQA